jgi:hypothetical protein
MRFVASWAIAGAARATGRSRETTVATTKVTADDGVLIGSFIVLCLR